jgi:hypothetical protein
LAEDPGLALSRGRALDSGPGSRKEGPRSLVSLHSTKGARAVDRRATDHRPPGRGPADP